MKTKKKNRFFTFCMACMPGAGQMYMGFMKMGLSMMLLFILTIIVATWMNLGVIASLCVVEWCYSFFHANHLASLSDEEFGNVKDEYFFGIDALPGMKSFVEKYHKWVAYGLILIGFSLLWSTMIDLLRGILPEQYYFITRIMWKIGNYIPSLVIGGVIIFLGIKMIGGKKMEVAEEKKEMEEKRIDGESRQNGQQEEG
ncbi:MAG: hypothetical protein K2H52_16805 [Lachnospiraceae bacterium]|nr:hypothetical protein [Lachnospiraceae bacterium]MDE6186406.1 hypothetical protein [Lachnospiraceae bacterium]